MPLQCERHPNAETVAGLCPRCLFDLALESSSEEDARFTPGTILNDRFQITALVGRGGMGEVYRADDLKIGQPVALKFVPLSIVQNDRLLVGTPSQILLVDATSGAILRSYQSPTRPFIFAPGSTGKTFWVLPSGGCDANYDNMIREYDITTGALASQRPYVTSTFHFDIPAYAVVENGWRAALSDDFIPDPIPANVTTLSAFALLLLSTFLALIALRRM